MSTKISHLLHHLYICEQRVLKQHLHDLNRFQNTCYAYSNAYEHLSKIILMDQDSIITDCETKFQTQYNDLLDIQAGLYSYKRLITQYNITDTKL